MKIDKFDFNDRLFELTKTGKIYASYSRNIGLSGCPVVDGFDYRVDGRKYWLGVYDDSKSYYFKRISDMQGFILANKPVGGKFYICIKEVGKDWNCLAYIKAEDIKAE